MSDQQPQQMQPQQQHYRGNPNALPPQPMQRQPIQPPQGAVQGSGQLNPMMNPQTQQQMRGQPPQMIPPQMAPMNSSGRPPLPPHYQQPPPQGGGMYPNQNPRMMPSGGVPGGSLPPPPDQMASRMVSGPISHSAQQLQMQQSQMQFKQNMNKYVKEEMPHFSYTQLPVTLEDLYYTQQNQIFKALFNQQNYGNQFFYILLGGKRQRKQQEPSIQASHQDFLIDEMERMAIDFQEESLYKRVCSVKCAKEAQRYIIQKKEEKKLREQQQMLEKQTQREIIQPGQAMDQEELKQDGPRMEQLIEDGNGQIPLKVSLSGLIKMDSMVGGSGIYDNNNLSNGFVDDPFFVDENQGNNPLSLDQHDNFLDNQIFGADFNQQSPLGNANVQDQIMIDTFNHNPDNIISNSVNIQPEAPLLDILLPKEIQPIVIQNVENDFQPQDIDANEFMDLYYQKPPQSQYSSIGQDNEDLSQFDTSSKQSQQEIESIGQSVLDQKLNKFKDHIINDHQIRQEEKKRRKRQRELMAKLQNANTNEIQQQQIQEELINIDNYLNGNNSGSKNDNSNIQMRQIQQKSKGANILPLDIPYKKQEVLVFTQNDLLSKGFEDQDFQDLPNSGEKNKDQEEQKIIPRPNTEDPYSDDDLDFFKTVPEMHDYSYYELFFKNMIERNRKQSLQHGQNQQKQKIVESDHLLNPDKTKKIIQKNLLLKENLNPCFQFDQEMLKQMFRPNYFKKGLSNIEQAFLFWYVSILGDEWRIIADVINYHPFTKGGIREPDEIKVFFFNLNEQLNNYYHVKIPIDPWRTTGLPILINQRPPSLLNSVHQQCLVQQNNLKVYQQAQQKFKSNIKIQISENQQGQIQLRVDKNSQSNNNLQKDQDSILKKRSRTQGSPEYEQNDSEQIRQGQEYMNTSVYQEESKLIPPEIIDETIQNQISYQQEIYQNMQDNVQFNLEIQDTQMVDISGHDQFSAAAQISFYQYYDKLYQPPLKRIKDEKYIQEEQKYNQYQELNNQSQSQLGLHRNELNTPLINALSKKIQENREPIVSNSTLQKDTTMYWLSYLLKKLYQQEKEMIVRIKNSQKVEQYEQSLKMVITKRILKKAEDAAKAQQMKKRQQQQQLLGNRIPLNNLINDNEINEQEQRLKKIQESLRTYEIEQNVANIDHIGNIWDGNTIFHYDQRQATQQLNQENESTADRPPEFLKQTWDKKWESMDFYWFQQHKHLGPNEKKKDPSTKYSENFLQQFQMQNQQIAGQQPQNLAAGAPTARQIPSPKSYQQGANPNIPGGINQQAGIPNGAPQQMGSNQNLNLMMTQQQISQQQQMQRQQQDMMRQQQVQGVNNGQPIPGYPTGVPVQAQIMQGLPPGHQQQRNMQHPNMMTRQPPPPGQNFR